MRHTICACFLFAGLLLASSVSAQSTISDKPWELTSGRGAWVSLLPAYELGSNTNGAPAFRDNLDDVGYIGQTKLVRRFLGTRTSFEVKGFWGYTESLNRTDAIDISVPNPSSGVANLFSGSPTRVMTNINYYGVDVALRDTWRTQFGGLSAGAAFSFMEFDQKFDADYGAVQLMRERLDTDYVGGKAIFGWDGCFRGLATNVDFGIGIYDMNGQYEFIGQTIAGSLERELKKTTTTFEASVTTRKFFRGYLWGLTLGGMYLSDMPTIVRTAPTTLGTDDAVTLTAQLEILL